MPNETELVSAFETKNGPGLRPGQPQRPLLQSMGQGNPIYVIRRGEADHMSSKRPCLSEIRRASCPAWCWKSFAEVNYLSVNLARLAKLSQAFGFCEPLVPRSEWPKPLLQTCHCDAQAGCSGAARSNRCVSYPPRNIRFGYPSSLPRPGCRCLERILAPIEYTGI